MDLKKRLASLDRLTRKPGSVTGAGQPERSPTDRALLAEESLGLQSGDTPFGPCFFRELKDSLSLPAQPFPDFAGFFTQAGSGGCVPAEVLFLDTETTGLAGGTGTLAFMIGVSWFRETDLATRQYFLPGPETETATLFHLQQLASGFKAVVTYNGASFDLPLLRTRTLLSRLDNPWDDILSWDLLVPARRLWSRRLDNCRQQTVESALGCPARDQRDLPGSLIPQTWFDFLRLGKTQGVQRVLYHNWKDMLGMVRIFQEVVAMAGSLDHHSSGAGHDWNDSWALGRIAERRGDQKAAIAWMARSWDRASAGAVTEARFIQDLLRIVKRSSNWDLVENIIVLALGSGQNDWWLHREAAILYEHRLTRLDRALEHALEAGDDHRVQRLRRKLKKGGH